MSDTCRLDHTSWYESILETLYILAVSFLGISLVALGIGHLEHHPVSLQIAGGMVLAAATAGLCRHLSPLADDTYLLHYPSRTLQYQTKRPWGSSQQVVAPYEDVQVVGVDYRFRPRKYETTGDYCLTLVLRDGRKLRVSDWMEDGYWTYMATARQLSKKTGWAILETGLKRGIRVGRNKRARAAEKVWEETLLRLCCRAIMIGLLLAAWVVQFHR